MIIERLLIGVGVLILLYVGGRIVTTAVLTSIAKFKDPTKMKQEE